MSDNNNFVHAQTYIFGSFDDANGNIGSATTYINSPSYITINTSSRGTFVLAAFSDGIHTATGSLTANEYAYTLVSSVPAPATAWLFSSGLMAVLSYTRRKSRV